MCVFLLVYMVLARNVAQQHKRTHRQRDKRQKTRHLQNMDARSDTYVYIYMYIYIHIFIAQRREHGIQQQNKSTEHLNQQHNQQNTTHDPATQTQNKCAFNAGYL